MKQVPVQDHFLSLHSETIDQPKALLRPANFTLGPEDVLLTYNVKSNSDLDGNSGGGRWGEGAGKRMQPCKPHCCLMKSLIETIIGPM